MTDATGLSTRMVRRTVKRVRVVEIEGPAESRIIEVNPELPPEMGLNNLIVDRLEIHDHQLGSDENWSVYYVDARGRLPSGLASDRSYGGVTPISTAPLWLQQIVKEWS